MGSPVTKADERYTAPRMRHVRLAGGCALVPVAGGTVTGLPRLLPPPPPVPSAACRKRAGDPERDRSLDAAASVPHPARQGSETQQIHHHDTQRGVWDAKQPLGPFEETHG